MTTENAETTENAAAVAAQGANVAPVKPSSKKGANPKKGAPKGQKAGCCASRRAVAQLAPIASLACNASSRGRLAATRDDGEHGPHQPEPNDPLLARGSGTSAEVDRGAERVDRLWRRQRRRKERQG